MHFNFIRNMIVVPLTINDKGPYNFILDTGVDLMIITDPALVDSLNITNKRLIRVTGMGEGNDFEAYLTSALKVSMPNVIGEHISAAILKKDEFGLSNYAGINIHGLLGYEFFSSFSVRVNFMDSTITMASPRDMRLFKRGDKIQMSIEDHKPYITSRISISGKTPEKENKLILDLGAGHPLSLENLIGENKGLPEKFIASNLGISLTGPINGFLSRIDQIEIGKYRITNVITSFPDYDTVKKNLIAVKRNGNLGMEILKKFNLIIDYQNGILYLKPNLSFKDQFEHDMSGMEYFADGPGLTHIIINNVERGSAAAEIGLKKGDELVKINFVPVERMGIEQIDHVFRSRENRSVLLEVFHDNIYEKFILTLKRRI
ncbi:aspartyl protease family protein [Mucilaginibacter paludis]|nr:aspartyl protease family protein [Mucilaginibacter paludis]